MARDLCLNMVYWPQTRVESDPHPSLSLLWLWPYGIYIDLSHEQSLWKGSLMEKALLMDRLWDLGLGDASWSPSTGLLSLFTESRVKIKMREGGKYGKYRLLKHIEAAVHKPGNDPFLTQSLISFLYVVQKLVSMFSSILSSVKLTLLLYQSPETSHQPP